MPIPGFPIVPYDRQHKICYDIDIHLIRKQTKDGYRAAQVNSQFDEQVSDLFNYNKSLGKNKTGTKKKGLNRQVREVNAEITSSIAETINKSQTIRGLLRAVRTPRQRRDPSYDRAP